MPIGKVWIYRLLFVCFLFVRLWIFPPRIKLVASNLAGRFVSVQGREFTILLNVCSPRSPKSDEWSCASLVLPVPWLCMYELGSHGMGDVGMHTGQAYDRRVWIHGHLWKRTYLLAYMLWGDINFLRQSSRLSFMFCSHCHYCSYDFVGKHGSLEDLYFYNCEKFDCWCLGRNLQAKLHGSASAKVLSVSEKQPPPEEVWTQKVQMTGMIPHVHHGTSYAVTITSANFGRG